MGETDQPYEDIEYVTIVRGENVLDGPKAAKEEVISDQETYTTFFEGSPPNTPDVNWEEEMVVAVALGVRATGGYSVEINRVRHHTTGNRQCTVEIRYVETVTSGVSI